MYFNQIIGHQSIKENLIKSVNEGHVGHALLFTGPDGSGCLPLAVAFAGYIFCSTPSKDDRCGQCKACKQMDTWNHPDLHLSFPIVKKGKSETSESYMQTFFKALTENPYMSLKGWEVALGEDKKKAIISTEESEHILRKLSLKSHQGGHKVYIIWCADKMNASSANKLLKTLEEPAQKTLIILISTSAEDLLPTIVSRTHIVNCGRLTDTQISGALRREYGLDEDKAMAIARVADGNFFLAKVLSEQEVPGDAVFFEMFSNWMRACVQKKPHEALQVAENFGKLSRDQQQHFFEYSLQFLHQSILFSYLGKESSRFDQVSMKFAERFAPYILASDLEGFHNVLSEGHYLVERNLNSQLLFMKMSRDMMKLFKPRS